MPVLSRFVTLGLQAAAFLATVGPGLAPLSSLATPVPSPVPLMPHIADYAARMPVKTYAGTVPVALGTNTSLGQPDANPSAVEGTPPAHPSGLRRRQDTLTTFITCVGILSTLLPSVSPSSIDYGAVDLSTSVNNTSAAPQEAVVAAAEISDTLRAFRDLLGDQQKGLANFDPNDPLEVVLKSLINATKDALEALDILVYKFPVLGPILGPSESSLSPGYRAVSFNRPGSRLRSEMYLGRNPRPHRECHGWRYQRATPRPVSQFASGHRDSRHGNVQFWL